MNILLHKHTQAGPLEVLMLKPGTTAAELINALQQVSPNAVLASMQGFSRFNPGNKAALRFRLPCQT
jgi:predicted esterase